MPNEADKLIPIDDPGLGNLFNLTRQPDPEDPLNFPQAETRVISEKTWIAAQTVKNWLVDNQKNTEIVSKSDNLTVGQMSQMVQDALDKGDILFRVKKDHGRPSCKKFEINLHLDNQLQNLLARDLPHTGHTEKMPLFAIVLDVSEDLTADDLNNGGTGLITNLFVAHLVTKNMIDRFTDEKRITIEKNWDKKVDIYSPSFGPFPPV